MSVRNGLKPLSELASADARNSYVRIDRETGEQTTVTLPDFYADIERYKLHGDVPEDIAAQYDVARNLYVYAWFEYRFFNVAEANALTVLELAMKMRIGDENIKNYIKQRNKTPDKKIPVRPGMKTLMEYCRDHKLICNEGFSQWHRYPTQQAIGIAEARQHQWAIAEMARTGASEIELPRIEIEPLPPDPSYDHIQHLIDSTNKIRNMYAHGSTVLHNWVLNSFEMVSEFINQLYLLKTFRCP